MNIRAAVWRATRFLGAGLGQAPRVFGHRGWALARPHLGAEQSAGHRRGGAGPCRPAALGSRLRGGRDPCPGRTPTSDAVPEPWPPLPLRGASPSAIPTWVRSRTWCPRPVGTPAATWKTSVRLPKTSLYRAVAWPAHPSRWPLSHFGGRPSWRSPAAGGTPSPPSSCCLRSGFRSGRKSESGGSQETCVCPQAEVGPWCHGHATGTQLPNIATPTKALETDNE